MTEDGFKYTERDERIRSKTDLELCEMLDNLNAWTYNLPPYDEPHPCPYIGKEQFNLIDEVTRRLRKYSKIINKNI